MYRAGISIYNTSNLYQLPSVIQLSLQGNFKMAKLGALSNVQLVTKLNAVVDANTVIQYYTKSLVEQRDIQLSVLENLPVHQEMARKHARYWQDNLELDIQRRIADTILFSKSFLERTDTLQILIDQMKEENEKAKADFIAIIKSLISKLVIVVCNSKQIIAKIEKFDSMLSHDERNFNIELKEAQTKLIGDEEELKVLQKQLESIDKAIDRDKALIAGGILVIWVAVGGAIDLKKQETARHDATVKIAMKRQELMALNAAKQQINGFVGSISSASQATTMLEQGWAALKSDLEEAVSELEGLTAKQAVEYLVPSLESAKKEWKVALDEAEKLKPKANLSWCDY